MPCPPTSRPPATRSACCAYLAERTAPVPRVELARDLGLPRSSVYQLLRALMDEGFVIHYPEDRTYGLSALVTEIGAGTLQTERLRRLALPLLERLVPRTAIPSSPTSRCSAAPT